MKNTRMLNFAIKISMRSNSNTTRNINRHGRFVRFLLTSAEESRSPVRYWEKTIADCSGVE